VPLAAPSTSAVPASAPSAQRGGGTGGGMNASAIEIDAAAIRRALPHLEGR